MVAHRLHVALDGLNCASPHQLLLSCQLPTLLLQQQQLGASDSLSLQLFLPAAAVGDGEYSTMQSPVLVELQPRVPEYSRAAYSQEAKGELEVPELWYRSGEPDVVGRCREQQGGCLVQ